jgi:hypothetical protein
MHIICYLRQGSHVFETYWATSRGVEVMDNSYRLLELKESKISRTDGRPTAQWPRLKAEYSDDLGTGRR